MSSEWHQTRWGEISTLNYGKRLSNYKNKDGKYRVYASGGIVGTSDQYLCPKNGVIVGRKGNLGFHYSDEAFFVIDTAFWLETSEIVDEKWSYYKLISEDISYLDSGSVIPSMSRESFYSLPVLLPSLNEQKKIAEILTGFENKIELNQKKIETLEEIAKALFKSWFIDFDPVRAASEDRSTGLPDDVSNLFPNSFEDSELGQIPKDWKIKNFDDICSNIYSGGTPNTKEATYWNGGIPWLSSGETRENYVIDTDKTISVLGVENSSTKLAKKGSTVIASAGQGHTRGQASILLIDTYVNQSVVVLNANSSKLSNYFLFLDCSRRYSEFRRVSDSSSSRGSLTTKILGSLKVILPPLEIMNHFDLFLTPIIERIGAAKKETIQLTSIRDLLLPKLISGELRIPDAEKVIEDLGI